MHVIVDIDRCDSTVSGKNAVSSIESVEVSTDHRDAR